MKIKILFLIIVTMHQIWAKKDDVPLNGHRRHRPPRLCIRSLLPPLSPTQVSEISLYTLKTFYKSDFRVFSGVGTLGTFVTMCILAVEITGPR